MKLIGAVTMAVVSHSVVGQAPSCGSSSSMLTLEQENVYCENMGVASNEASFDGCCGNERGDDARRLLGMTQAQRVLAGSEECRYMESSQAYCDVSQNSECPSYISSTDILTIDFTMESPGSAENCCSNCVCYGDPECISFNGVQDEWIVCDGRRGDTCEMNRRVCEKQIDWRGQACRWVRNDPWWVSREESGSPCQPDWQGEFPTMTMYEFPGFKVELTLGERGIISVVEVSHGNGETYTLDATKCFEYDPRTSSTPELAWQSTSGSIPSSWSVSTPVETEIWWKVTDSVSGVFLDVVCTKSIGSNLARINVQNLIETDPTRPTTGTAGGFCTSGIIGEKAGTTSDSSWMHSVCLRQNLPNMVYTCKALANEQCREYTLEQDIAYWCNNADLSNTLANGDVDTCIALLSTDDKVDAAGNWTQMVCEANHLNVEQCMTEISQFGWDNFLQSHSDGLVDQGNAQVTCESDVMNYGTSADSCEEGVSVEYYKDGQWTEAFFIPALRPPCGNKMLINGDQYPELFMYKIRMSQCHLKSECLVENSCRPALGFSSKLSFDSETCPTPAPTDAPSPSPTPSPTCSNKLVPGNEIPPKITLEQNIEVKLTLELNQLVCGSGPANVFKVGCNDDEYLSVNVKDCSTTLDFAVMASDGSMVTCTASQDLVLESVNELFLTVKEETLTVTLNPSGSNVVICSEPVPGDMMTAEDVCVYASAPDVTEAYSCEFNLDIRTIPTFSDCFYCASSTTQQKVCEVQEDFQAMGDCESCCTADDDFLNPNDDERCRELVMDEPYCDLSNPSESQWCNQLKTKNGKLRLKMTLDTSGEPCCLSCKCFGDPECVAFDGSYDKWILCDGRDTSCIVKEDVCSTLKDHAGNACLFDQARADALVNRRADIPAVGSPCQADWTASGQAWMTMYAFDGFQARISMGERGVIETLEISNAGGVYTLVADRCFTDNAWDATPGSLPVENVFSISERANGVEGEKELEIVDATTGLFFRVLCIRRVSRDGNNVGYRMNVQNLVELNETRAKYDGEGFCAMEDATIDALQSTRSPPEIYETCNVDALGVNHLLCKSLWNPSCTALQVETGVAAWCTIANIYPDDPNRVNKCINYIGTNGNRWAELYCKSIASRRPPQFSISKWVQECKSQIQVDGPQPIVDQYGQGSFTTSGVELCGEDESHYSTRTEAEQCLPGISIEYQKTDGTWEEELFIPYNLPPCGGELTITANKHYNLFTRPIRYRQCEISQRTCPVDVGCLPNVGFEIDYLFSKDASVCPPSQSRLR